MPVIAAALVGCVQPASFSAAQWRVEAESPAARVTFGDVIDIDTPAGLSLWLVRPIKGPVAIGFDAMAVAKGGANDQVSDLNAFWMAREADGAPLRHGRSGAFADYDTLATYYVGIGGNRNTTTRFRRYVGRVGDRPILPQHDRSDAGAMLQPDRWTRITLIADGSRIAVERDGQAVFRLDDPQPYRAGHFAIRTTQSHLRIRNLTIQSLGN
ncbi:DUF6250 domain-containing protein [Sphingomonas sp. 37zxx]|uniref:DUF6250 domain-containing protein n=1 Tax=Sphingomonas sp. 37zxx TaxID=1550073 RepID=UPI00053BDC01|nr:DUF6250 domain-containing protein [Sphingomonas sp. 37zxx]